MNTVDYSYLYGITLLNIDNFAELFLACSVFKDGVLDINREMVYTRLPFEYEDNMDDFLHNVNDLDINILSKVYTIVDVDSYYKSERKWHESLDESFTKYLTNNRDVYIRHDEDNEENIIGMPTKKVFEILNKYDNDMIESMMLLTSYAKDEELDEVTKLKKLIDSTGGVNRKRA